MLGDVKYALRQVAKRRGFAAVAVLTLALGVGANVALVSVVYGVLLRPLAFPEPGRLVRVLDVQADDIEGSSGHASYPNIADWNRQAGSFRGIGGVAWWTPALTDDVNSEVVRGATVSWNWFDILGVQPAAGRFFRADDEGEGRAPVVVLSHELWQRRYGGDRGVIGRAIEVSGSRYTVIGVAEPMPDDPIWNGPGWEAAEIWRTPWFDAATWYRSGRSWRAVGRLADGVSLAAAQTELSGVMDGLVRTYPEENAGRAVRLVRVRDYLVGDTKPALWMLLGAVGLVLLTAAVNVAGLLLGRAVDRSGELSVRRALGATHGRLVRQAVVESVVLASLAGAVGVALTFFSIDSLLALAGSALPRSATVKPDGPVLAFSALLTVATGVVIGLVPALRITQSGSSPTEAFGRWSSAGPSRSRFRRGLVVVQVAMTVTLLTGSGLLLRSFGNLLHEDLGIEREGVLTFEVHDAGFLDLDPTAATLRYREIFDRIRAVPGVSTVGAIDYLPMSGGYSTDGVARDDLPPPAPGEGRAAETRSVTPGILDALGVPVLRGRSLEWTDDHRAARVVLVSRQMAEEFWPEGDPLGKRITVHGASFEVVGIVGDIAHFGPGTQRRSQLYFPAAQEPWNGIARGLSIVVRLDGRPQAMIPAIRQAVRSVDASIPMRGFRPLNDLMAEVLAAPRFRTVLVGVFGGLALLLSIVGMAGIMASSVGSRTREIGIRIAVGAAPTEMRRMVLTDATKVVLLGLAVGVPGALVAGRVLASFLFGVGTADPWVLGTACVLLTGAALAAAWPPARRATRVDPIEALRSE